MMTMLKDRKVVWDGIGTDVSDAITVDAALAEAGLGFNVEKETLHRMNGDKVSMKALVRDDNFQVLGYCSDQYKIVQPNEALSFLNDLLKQEGVELDTAGALRGGSRIWVNAKLPERTVLGDAIGRFLGISTSYDSSSGTSVFEHDIRIVCQNTLNMAQTTSIRKWSCRHTSSIEGKQDEVARIMELGDLYFHEFEAKAERFAKTKVDAAEFMALVHEVFGDPDMMKDREKTNWELQTNKLATCLVAPDLANHKGTAWGVYNAFADFCSHSVPLRETEGWKERRLEAFIDGNPIMRKVEVMLDEMAA